MTRLVRVLQLLKLHVVSVETGGESNTVTRSTTRITVFCAQGEGVQTFHLGSFSIVFFTPPLWNLMPFTQFSIPNN